MAFMTVGTMYHPIEKYMHQAVMSNLPTRTRIWTMAGLVVAILSWVPANAQQDSLRGPLEQLKAKADSTIQLLLPVLGGQDLSTWDGRTSLSPAQVQGIEEEVAEVLVRMQVPLEMLAARAALRLEPHVLAPVTDDINIITRDLVRSLERLHAAAEVHTGQVAHPGGCDHANYPMRQAVELVRDVRATLALIEGTLDLYGITDAQ